MKLLIAAFALAFAANPAFAQGAVGTVATASRALSAADFVKPMDCSRTSCATVSQAMAAAITAPKPVARRTAKPAEAVAP